MAYFSEIFIVLCSYFILTTTISVMFAFSVMFALIIKLPITQPGVEGGWWGGDHIGVGDSLVLEIA